MTTSTLFQVHEDDLAKLESVLPELVAAVAPTMTNRLRTQLRQVQKILSDVRWGYGPPTDVERVPTEPDQVS